MISRNTIDKIRDLPILDVVSRYVPDLKKSGTSWKSKSPFTSEKTGSFFVVPQKNIFKDFSSGVGGDSIKFVMEFQKLPYPEAIKEICRDHSITIEEEVNGHSPEETKFTDELHAVNRAVAKKYAEQLLDTNERHPAFTEVLNKRMFTLDTVIEWQLGYAPDQWNFLSHVMISAGKSNHGHELGLIKTKGERTYDTFRHRLMFPIQDERGHVVAFGGRYLAGAEVTKVEKGDVAKYINSPESRIYLKSKILYGLFQAMPAIRKSGYACLVEGYTDVISFHQVGMTNTVGSCGTSLTEEQVNLLKRYTSKVVLYYDGDTAGRRAANRAIDLLLISGIECHITPLPDGTDPDDFARMYNN